MTASTRIARRAHRLAAMIRAGVVGINHHGSGDIYAPFGGLKASGWGREFGAESLDAYLDFVEENEKAFVHFVRASGSMQVPG